MCSLCLFQHHKFHPFQLSLDPEGIEHVTHATYRNQSALYSSVLALHQQPFSAKPWPTFTQPVHQQPSVLQGHPAAIYLLPPPFRGPWPAAEYEGPLKTGIQEDLKVTLIENKWSKECLLRKDKGSHLAFTVSHLWGSSVQINYKLPFPTEQLLSWLWMYVWSSVLSFNNAVILLKLVYSF